MEKDNNETKIFSKFFWILFSIISILWIIIAIITELDETQPTPIDELIGYNIILLSVWFTFCIIISFLVNIVKKLLKKKNTNDIQLSKEEIETTKLESENHINDNKNMYINDDKITIKENNIIDKKTIVSEKDEMKDKKNNKTNNNSKPLFTCDSIIDAEEYGKMAKYFPRFYWYFVIIGAGINLLITAVIAIISRNLIISLVFFVVYQIYLMILYKVKLEYYAKKIFNPQNMESEIHSEFYDDYFIRQGEIETLKIYYSDINRCIETDTNFYLEFKKRNKVIFIQKNRCELQLIQFIREKFSNIDNRLGDSSKLKRARKTHNTKFIKIFMIILFVYKKLSNDVHSKSYIDNLKSFYKNVEVKNYKYNFFYYDGSNYVFDYYLDIKYDNKDYTLIIQITPYKEKVAFTAFGFRDDNVEIYSDLYNLLFSVFYW